MCGSTRVNVNPLRMKSASGAALSLSRKLLQRLPTMLKLNRLTIISPFFTTRFSMMGLSPNRSITETLIGPWSLGLGLSSVMMSVAWQWPSGRSIRKTAGSVPWIKSESSVREGILSKFSRLEARQTDRGILRGRSAFRTTSPFHPNPCWGLNRLWGQTPINRCSIV